MAQVQDGVLIDQYCVPPGSPAALKLTTPKQIAYQTSVVTRLRATFLFLALISCGAAAFSVWQLTSLDRSHTQLVGGAVPILRHTHELQAQLTAVLEIAARAASGQTHQQLEVLETQLNQKTESIRYAIDSAKWPERTSLARNQIASLLNALQSVQKAGVAHRIEVLGIDKKLREQWDRLRQTRSDFRDLIEPLLIKSAAKLEAAEIRLQQPDALSDGKYRADLSTLITYQMNLTQIAYRFSALIDTAENQLGDEISKSITELAKRLRFEFTGVMQVLIRLPESPGRKNLALELSKTRNILFSDTGMVALLTSLVSKIADIKQSDQRRLEVVASINSHADELVAAASHDADKAAIDFREDLTGALAVMAITITIVLLVLGAVWILVVERQISRRMSSLTDSVSAIAEGDNAVPVDVTGHDELGKMGAALEVFKSNATELRRSNEELESFAYAAAHDMRSPLRAIESLAQWTLDDAGDQLPGDCRQNLEKLLSRANRLSKLQSDLLDYSRISKLDGDQRPLDLRLFIQNIQELLDPDEQFNFDIDVPAQFVEVPETPLRQILINLTTNAIKHHDREAGTISVKAELVAGRLVVAVGDDGPGIEPRFHGRIFKLFQTLKSRDIVEGSGLGLSYVLKHLNRYDGSIQVLSEPSRNRGTTFVFDLPARLAASEFEETADQEAEIEPAHIT